jgi:hypothetical protein
MYPGLDSPLQVLVTITLIEQDVNSCNTTTLRRTYFATRSVRGM